MLMLRMIYGLTGRGFLLARGLGFVLFVSRVLRGTRRTLRTSNAKLASTV